VADGHELTDAELESLAGQEASDAKGPRGEKRPGDVIGIATMVAKIGAGEIEDAPKSTHKTYHSRGAA
jgi:hypothetical protein